jgi:alkylated DNA repair dioxygenase AlkB
MTPERLSETGTAVFGTRSPIRETAQAVQLNLLPPASTQPKGFEYRTALMTPEEEDALTARFRDLPFREFEFHGFLGKRQTVSFGLRYDFADMKMHRAEAIPDFLLPLRTRAAAFAGIAPDAIEHALVTEYTQGAAIGWHRDRPVFGDVIGVSFGSACRFRFRRKRGAGWERAAIALEPRSAYLMRGPARSEWEHSIPPAEALRYSVTFRTICRK